LADHLEVARLGSVHHLDQPSEARRIVRRLREQIRSGALVPGSHLKVPELASRHRLRPPVLAGALDRLVDDGLLAVYLDRLVVTALSPREFAAIMRLRQGVGLPLYEEAHQHLSLSELDRIETRLKVAAGPTLVGTEECPAGDAAAWGRAMCEMNLRLSRAAGSGPVLRAFSHLLADCRRYNSLGWAAMLRDSDAGAVLTRRRQSLGYCFDLIDSLRSGNPKAVQDSVLRHHADACSIAEASLIREHTAPAGVDLATRSGPAMSPSLGRLSAQRATTARRAKGSSRGTHLRVLYDM
jgi:DNA-binding GntR family transcriptional regulator